MDDAPCEQLRVDVNSIKALIEAVRTVVDAMPGGTRPSTEFRELVDIALIHCNRIRCQNFSEPIIGPLPKDVIVQTVTRYTPLADDERTFGGITAGIQAILNLIKRGAFPLGTGAELERRLQFLRSEYIVLWLRQLRTMYGQCENFNKLLMDIGNVLVVKTDGDITTTAELVETVATLDKCVRLAQQELLATGFDTPTEWLAVDWGSVVSLPQKMGDKFEFRVADLSSVEQTQRAISATIIKIRHQQPAPQKPAPESSALPENDRWKSYAEAEALTGENRGTVKRWADANEITTREYGGSVQVDIVDVLRRKAEKRTRKPPANKAKQAPRPDPQQPAVIWKCKKCHGKYIDPPGTCTCGGVDFEPITSK